MGSFCGFKTSLNCYYCLLFFIFSSESFWYLSSMNTLTSKYSISLKNSSIGILSTDSEVSLVSVMTRHFNQSNQSSVVYFSTNFMAFLIIGLTSSVPLPDWLSELALTQSDRNLS